MICKRCNSEIADNSRFCNYCGVLVENREPWNITICKDESLWNRSIFEAAPSIIAHEYHRIFQLLLQNQTYGAMMQVKDLLEVLIKFPVAVEMSRLRAKEEKNEKDYKFLYELLGKPLSLGHWRSAITYMSSHDEHVFDSNFISDLNDMYTKNKVVGEESIDIVNWRNQTIGHGALAFDNDDRFKREFKSLLALIACHFNKWDKLYKNLKLYMKDNEDIVFRGKDAALNLKYDHSSVCFENHEGIKLQLYPFLLLWDKQFYIFDAFIWDKEKYDVLCYPIGRKKHFKKTKFQKDIMDIFDQCGNVLKRDKYLVKSMALDVSAEDSAFLTSYDDYLNENNEKIYDMEMLDNWLSQGLAKAEDRTFLLMMERGMGKTTWVKNISKGRVFGHDIMFKTIYLNDTYRSRQESIVSKIDQVMVTDNNHVAIFEDTKNRHIRMDSEDLKQEIADFCKYYMTLYKKEQKAEKIVLVLDGIDEVTLDNNNNILSCIPTSDMLPEDFYILLTCRNPENISELLKVWLGELRIPEKNKLTVYREDEDYRKVLATFINSHLSKSDTSDILNKAEFRFAYVSILTKILEQTEEERRSSVLESGSIMKAFLEMIEKNYEKKYLEYIYDILYSIAIAPEPVTVKELSYMIGDNKVGFAMLGMLNDLKGILKYERTDKKNKISMANQLYKESLFKVLSEKDYGVEGRFNTTTVDLISDMYTEFVAKGADIVGEGQEFLLLHLNYYYNEDMAQYIDYELFISIFHCAERLIKSFSTEDTKRGYEMLENADRLDFDVSAHSRKEPLIQEFLKRHIHLVFQYKLLFRWKDLYINDDITMRLEETATVCIEQYKHLDKLIEYKDKFLMGIIADTVSTYTNVLIECGGYYLIGREWALAKEFLLKAKNKADMEKIYDPMRYKELHKSLYMVCTSLGETEEASKYYEQYGKLKKEQQDKGEKDYEGIIFQEILQELMEITDLESSEKKVFDMLEELENNLKKLEGNSFEYYQICESESMVIMAGARFIGQEHLNRDNHTKNLEFLGKLREVGDKLIKRNFPLLPEAKVFISYHAGISNMALGYYDRAISELELVQEGLEQIDQSQSLIRETEDNVLFLKYVSNLYLGKCSVFNSQDYEKAFSYFMKAAEAYEECIKVSKLDKSKAEDFLKQILGLYNAILANTKEANEDKLKALKALHEKYNKHFEEELGRANWTSEYVIIDRRKDKFLSCANGEVPKRFELSGKYYGLDFKKLCNRCSYKDCLGYQNSGRFKLEK